MLHEDITGKIIKAFYKVFNNYLRATKIEIGMLLNFGVNPEFRRKIFTNDLKK